ncbi:MAG: DNA translocase FtsK 4TM domain-containing protein, partial [Candidatus Omnitrophica bacterium]|nr:DNA translocase FtsK 4TM domain-containing protein [Candidatus Omnitrophota bacterium]
MLHQKKKNEIIAFVWLIAAILLFFCLISYDPHDIPWNTSDPNNPPVNYVGIAGAYAAWILSLIIGKGAYGWVMLFVFWSLAQWSDRRPRSVWLSILSGTLFFISSSTSLTLMFGYPDSSVYFDAGGMIGFFCAAILYQSFGSFALFVSLSIFLIALMLATDFILLPIVVSIFKKGYPLLHNLLVKAAGLFKKSAESVKINIQEKKPQPAKTKIKIVDWEKQSEPTVDDESDEVSLSGGVQPKNTKPQRVKEKAQQNQPVKPASPAKNSDSKSAQSGGDPIKGVEFTNYKLPSISILEEIRGKAPSANTAKVIEEQSAILQETLSDFGVDAKVVEAEQGPVITRFELQPASGVKLQKITSLQDNIALALKATSVRILAPIPGKNRVGVEVPNPEKRIVSLRSILQSQTFKEIDSKLAIALGMDAAGKPLVADLDQMPHMLIAGATGSGKTVCMNTIIMSILFNATPNEVKFIMIDPKMVELNCYNGIPHLLLPVVTNVDKAPNVLHWLTIEMERRYKLLSKSGDREVE